MQISTFKNVVTALLRGCFVLLCCAGTGQAQVFTGGFIDIVDNAPASPYPSTISVSGLSSSILAPIKVTLHGLSHTFPDDIDIRLQSPSGSSITLMADNGGSVDVVGITLTFDDAGISLPPGSTLVSTTYKPSSGSLSSFNGTNPNGTWSLFVEDDFVADIGQIMSWSIDFSGSELPKIGITAVPIGPSTCFASDGKIQILGLEPNTLYRTSYERLGAFFETRGTSDERGYLFIENLVAGTYRRIIVDLGQGRSITTAPVELVSTGAPSFALETAEATTCLGEGAAMLAGLEPNKTYRIMLSRNGTAMAAQNMSSNAAGKLVISNLQGGVFSLVVGLNGCNSATQEFKLAVPPSPTLVFDKANQMSVCGQSGSIDFKTTNLSNGNYLMSYALDGYEQGSALVTVTNNKVSLTNLNATGYYSRFKISGGACSAAALSAVPLVMTLQPSISALRLVTHSCPTINNGVIMFATTNLPNGSYTVSYDGPGGASMGSVINNVMVLGGLSPGTYSGFSVTLNNCTAYDGSVKTISDIGACASASPILPPVIPVGLAKIGIDKNNDDKVLIAEAMPNPATNVVYVKLNNLKGKEVSLGLVSMLGRSMINRKVTPISDREIVDIDIRALQPGVYLLEAITGEQRQTLKVLKIE